jgi:AAA15 family ATPase/GTPase
MIKKIKIENFKSIQSLDLDLGRLNVFIGANGSGKSNILEGIAFGAAAATNKIGNEFLYPRGIRITKNSLMKSAFENADKGQNINVIFEDENKDYVNVAILDMIEWVVDIRRNSFREKYDREYRANIEIIENLEILNTEKGFKDELEKRNIPHYRELTDTINNEMNQFFLNNAVNNFLIFAPENHFLRRFEDEGQIQPLGVKGEGLFKHIVEIFREYPEKAIEIKENLQLIDWFEDFEIPKDLMFTEKRIAIKDRFLEKGLSDFDQRSANEGFLYLLFYFTLFISDKTPKFFAIDNIDNALNPKLGKRLIKVLAQLAKEHQKQAILTTHNPAILDGLDLNDDEQRLFVVFRNGDGHTKVKRIFKKEMPEGVAPMPLSEMFLKGIIGGLPNNF